MINNTIQDKRKCSYENGTINDSTPFGVFVNKEQVAVLRIVYGINPWTFWRTRPSDLLEQCMKRVDL
jgi:hypothetical protein